MLNPFLSMIIIRMNVFAFLFVKEQIRAFFCWYLWTTEKGITNGEKWHTKYETEKFEFEIWSRTKRQMEKTDRQMEMSDVTPISDIRKLQPG